MKTTDGVLHWYDTGGTGPVVMWFHGSPQTGRPLAPVVDAAAARGIRLLSYARPAYGGSTPRPGRTVADAAADAVAVADAAGVERFATMGASGGGPHALAAAALAPDRVFAAVCLAGLAPFADDDGWWQGMVAPDALQAARGGRDARAAFAEVDEFDPESFNARDEAALAGAWRALGEDVGASAAWGDDGLIDDDVAFVSPWGFSPADVRCPVLLAHGTDDRVVPVAHGERLRATLPAAELWRRDGDGHIAVLDAVPAALDWVLARTPDAVGTPPHP